MVAQGAEEFGAGLRVCRCGESGCCGASGLEVASGSGTVGGVSAVGQGEASGNDAGVGDRPYAVYFGVSDEGRGGGNSAGAPWLEALSKSNHSSQRLAMALSEIFGVADHKLT